MKTRWVGVCAGLWLVMTASNGSGAGREDLWKPVDDAVRRGLPRTAITNIEPILKDALERRDYPEAVRALGRRIALEGTIEGGRPDERILRLEKELPTATAEMKPMLETLLAHWYWAYYQRNQWRLAQRATTSEPPGTDFTTWDLPRLYAEIAAHFDKALSNAPALKQIPVQTWDGLLTKGTMPEEYRPTLYDFIAHEALEFFTVGAAPLKPQGAFEISANSPALDSLTAFLNWNPGVDTNSLSSPQYRALQLFQDLARFHSQETPTRPALAHVDLERLTWAWNTAVGDTKTARYKSALRGFIREYQDLHISALASERLARVFHSENDLVSAREVAAAAVAKYPESPGGKLCRNLIREIEAKSVAIRTEHVWNAPWPDITVDYRNIDRVYFKAVRANWEEFLDRSRSRPENLRPQDLRDIMNRPAALSWSTNLPPTTNYTASTLDLPAPSSLRPGFYFIFASCDAEFGAVENMVTVTTVWVSDLALITRLRHEQIEGFVMNANSGEPLQGAEVSAWHLDALGQRVAHPVVRADANGFFTVEPEPMRGLLLRARYNGHEVATRNDVGVYSQRVAPKPRGQTTFFTDRAIYRPGQTIQYKGICLWVDTERDKYEVLKGEKLTVIFADQNGQEIARRETQANDYGSFSGSFTAPRNVLMGQMTLRVEGRAEGGIGIRVEEYKRPKFQVELKAPESAPRLNETVTIPGKATSYTGAAVDGAQVTYRVVRQVRWPWWWGHWRGAIWPPIQSQPQEIAHGTARTAADGTFKIEFKAEPDLAIAETNNPSFNFQITADITDSAGETRSDDRNVRVGYTALEAKLTANEWQTAEKPVEIQVRTITLDDDPQSATGTVKIYALKQPDKVYRPPLERYRPYPMPRSRGAATSPADPDADPSDPRTWPLGEMVAEKRFTTDTNGVQKLEFALKAGIYRVVVETQDRLGKAVKGELPVQVLSPAEAKFPIKIAQQVTAPSWDLQPGEELQAVWGTGYDVGRAFIEIEHRGKMLQRFWTTRGRTQQQIKVAVTEAMRGGFTLHVTQVRENRALLESKQVAVPWKNKGFTLKWERMVSKLEPGQKETWSLSIAPTLTNSSDAAAAARVAAELVATLYDASLDAFVRHEWPNGFDVFRHEHPYWPMQFANLPADFRHVLGNWRQDYQSVDIRFRDFEPGLVDQRTVFRRAYAGRLGAVPESASVDRYALAPAPAAKGIGGVLTLSAAAAPQEFARRAMLADAADASPSPAGGAAPGPRPADAPISPRKNLNETAFFFPHLTTDSNGVVRMSFTMPEALTKWRFLGFAHDRELRSGLLEGETVTARDLMVQPNPPRFLREGDTVEFTVKVTNQSDQPQRGRVRLNFNLAANDQSADALLKNTNSEQPFDIPAKESRSYSWRISVPDGCGFLTYKAVASSDRLADGEEGAVPVLPRRILVIESMPLPIRDAVTKRFEFEKLLKSGASDTLRHESFTAQMVSNPAWYAVLALPYLMEYPHECSEQVFNRLYANTLARHIANSNPRIRQIFDRWKNTPAVDSPLEKNEDLRSVMLEETPWVRQAKKESEARRNVGVLFDENRLNSETSATLDKLAQMQLPDGAWPWFPGGRADDFITLYITTGFGRLRHLGADVRVDPALRSLARLDNWIAERYRRIQESKEPEKHVPSSIECLYLYGRSFFLKETPIAAEHRTAVSFFLAQGRKLWVETNNRQSQAYLAMALQRFATADRTTDATPAAIMNSLRERSVSNEEMGMFWRDTELSWWWYRAPIETQALMIEAFDEVAKDQRAVEDCRVWLLKQKQTRDWKTTKATADAVYALLLRGRDLLGSDALVQLRVGDLDLTPSATNPLPAGKKPSVEPGTGFYEVRFAANEVRPEMGRIEVRKTDAGVAWGSVHWQYFEDMAKVTPHTNTPLTLVKKLYLKRNTASGPVIEPVRGALAPGDELVTRVELRTDRDMEYVHLKDQRGSGTEPVNVLSRYKYQDGLAYYESTRDTASHFFIDYLPKGTYVFEYSVRVQLKGEYQTGVAHIECMYAPEFNSHSGSTALVVR